MWGEVLAGVLAIAVIWFIVQWNADRRRMAAMDARREEMMREARRTTTKERA
jgi:hypothetical protein